MKKEKKKLRLDNFTVARLEETEKIHGGGGGDGGGDTVKTGGVSKACFPPKK